MHPMPAEGRIAIVTARWAREAMDAAISGATAWFRKKSRSGAGRRKAAYGEIVWSWRRDPGATPAGDFVPATGARKAAPRGERV